MGSTVFPMMETWRDLILAPGGARGEVSPPTVAKMLNTLFALLLIIGAVTLCLMTLDINWVWGSVWDHRSELFWGWMMTVGVTGIALVLSTLGGFVLALCQRSFFLPLRYFTKVVVEIVRCTPLLVLILVVWYGFCNVFRVENRYFAGILILTLFESAYISEIFRAGIESIGKSQIESARAIGFTRVQTYRYVIIPQAFRQVLPPLVGTIGFAHQGLVAAFLYRHQGIHFQRAAGELEYLQHVGNLPPARHRLPRPHGSDCALVTLAGTPL